MFVGFVFKRSKCDLKETGVLVCGRRVMDTYLEGVARDALRESGLPDSSFINALSTQKQFVSSVLL